jgi:hypothetical protein
MATTQVAPGVELTHPSSVRVDVISAGAGPAGLGGMRRMRAAAGETTALPAGLADSGLSVAAEVVLTPPRRCRQPLRWL